MNLPGKGATLKEVNENPAVKSDRKVLGTAVDSNQKGGHWQTEGRNWKPPDQTIIREKTGVADRRSWGQKGRYPTEFDSLRERTIWGGKAL